MVSGALESLVYAIGRPGCAASDIMCIKMDNSHLDYSIISGRTKSPVEAKVLVMLAF